MIKHYVVLGFYVSTKKCGHQHVALVHHAVSGMADLPSEWCSKYWHSILRHVRDDELVFNASFRG